ncbi:nucleotide-binding universal stress UspA family protein [Silvibacterium bohemicum]|uniref:Nucleotide-binding universal stress UspA family protein n=1 Tax=Silvibacterium bohemicum TaxID=1577686 RepID=A0A841JTK5_9BACT|nr:universal stress protein [Silvibacterium bohemicum]MBB6143817.1 nucleotide-binding universal stress UspA family protein [Silvibacterium bohemicum]
MRKDALTFRTIAVATDLSEAASFALRYAQEIARRHESTLVIVHVIDPVSYAFPAGASDEFKGDQAARDELRRIEEDTRRKGITVHSVIESGIICECILQSLADHHVDLLVLGTRGKTEAGRVALGTVARQLLGKASCSILTISPGADISLPWAGQWRRVLAATDFSAASLAALNLAQSIVHEQLLVLHTAHCANQHECSHCLERLRFLAPFNESHTVPVNHIVASGDEGQVIAAYAHSFDADLVVLGSPGRELSEEDLPRSTILQVISHVSCPVLCVPAARGTTEGELIQEVAFAC